MTLVACGGKVLDRRVYLGGRRLRMVVRGRFRHPSGHRSVPSGLRSGRGRLLERLGRSALRWKWGRQPRSRLPRLRGKWDRHLLDLHRAGLEGRWFVRVLAMTGPAGIPALITS